MIIDNRDTNESPTIDLPNDWRRYEVHTPEGPVVRLRDLFVMCLGPYRDAGYLFDPGGEQGASCPVLRAEGDRLISVNPDDVTETSDWGEIREISS